MVAPVLTPTLKEQWDHDGWCVVADVIPAVELRAAQDAVRRLFPTPAEMAEGADPDRALWRTWDAQ